MSTIKADSMRFGIFSVKRSLQYIDKNKFPEVFAACVQAIKAVEAVIEEDNTHTRAAAASAADSAALASRSAAWSAAWLTACCTESAIDSAASAAARSARSAAKKLQAKWLAQYIQNECEILNEMQNA